MKVRRSALAAIVLGLTLSLAGPASAEPKDAQAEAARKKALEEDFLETRFDDALQRLHTAIRVCGDDACSRKVTAKLYMALGAVLAGGKKELSDARDAFVEALRLDPKAAIDPDVVSAEVTFAFEEARKRIGHGSSRSKKGAAVKEAREKAQAEPTGTDEPDPKEHREPSDDARPPVPPAEPRPVIEARRNWITLTFSPDVAFVSGDNVCTRDTQTGAHTYCVRRDGSHYVGTPTLNNGDTINLGAALATLRITLGYDRLLGEHLTLGARLGFAFNGSNQVGASFFPVHAEARLAVWPGAAPFAGTGLRPFLFLAGGVAQVDAHVDVQILEDGNACGAESPRDATSPCTQPSRDGVLESRKQTVSAYKQAGLAFAAGGVGVQIAVTPGAAFHLAVRGAITFPSVAPVISPEAGFALGF